MKKAILLMWILVLGIAPLNLAIDRTWTIKTDMPTARIYLSTSVVNGKIYAIGGATRKIPAAISVSTVEEYDPSTDTWIVKSPMPTPRWGFATGTVEGKIYAIGGAEGYPGSPLTTVEEYNPATDTWTTKSPMPTARWGLSASVVNGKIYAIGGGIPSGYRDVEEYDPVTDTWTKKASIPIGRYAISTSAVNGKIYAIGGVVSYPTITPKVHEYNPVTDTWTTKADMLTARAYPSTCVVDGKIYAMGGAQRDPDNPPVPTVEVYDPMIDVWTSEADMPTARTVFSTSVVNGKIYVMGGSTTGSWDPDLKMVEEYDTYPFVVDLNRDQKVDCSDMCIMISYLDTDESFCDIAPPPLGDGVVDTQDLILLTEHMFDDYRAMAQWKLDEKSGNIAYETISGLDATLQGDPVWRPVSGKFIGALELDGIDDYIRTPFVLNPGKGSMSVVAWIKGGLPGQVIISQADVEGQSATESGGTWLGISPSDGKLMTGLMSIFFGTLESESVVADEQWHHVGLVYDFNAMKRHLYVDGAEVAVDDGVVAGVQSTAGLYIGAGQTLEAPSFFSGLIDDVRIYNRALTPEEIKALAQ
jgi:N-acetylneuraminic acid mutarotase